MVACRNAWKLISYTTLDQSTCTALTLLVHVFALYRSTRAKHNLTVKMVSAQHIIIVHVK